MKQILFLIICLLSAISYSQEREFKNQGEREDYQSSELFKKEYSQQTHEKFNGWISVINDNTITFDNKTLTIWNIESELLDIFIGGIFYPQILIGNEENTITKTESEVSQLSDGERFKYYISQNDSLRISNFQELTFLSPSPKIKRFRFWVYKQGFANPQVYFIELTNENATSKTDIKTFIKEARLTFAKGAWIII